ncbi:MAG TPA: hypothetical protein VG711_07975, partial [Phycisphaerales bacterium]|nr:hypothetical protein [Phycisphaerales bacterium]
APPDGSAPTTTTPDEDETPKPKKHKKKSEESDAAMAIGPGTPIAPTHADARQSDPVTTKPAYQIIGVKWGGISNSPKEDDEILQLLDENDKVVCEVNIQEKNGWPSCKKPDGPSIFLADIHVKNLNDGKNWKRSAAGKFGARYNNVTDVFTGKDIGSPGYVPQLSGEAPAAAPAAKKPASSKKPESTPDDGDIDY